MWRVLVRYRFILPMLMLFSAAASGAVEKDEAKVLTDPHPDWTVAVAAFDTEGLEVSDRLAGDLIAGKLADALFGVAERSYPDAERAAYASRLAALNLESAVKDLAAKRSARDALLFSGHAAWKYKRELKKAEKDVRSAHAAYEAALVARPEVVAGKPIKAAAENSDGGLLAAPKKGEEWAFCSQRSYDALLLGRVESYYGRTAVAIRLYSPYLNADLYADETLFSVVNREKALAELSRRLAAAASGRIQAALAVRVEPEAADIHLSGVFSGKGTVGPLERDPGKVTINAELGGFERFEETVELVPGERAELMITLPPIETNDLIVRAFDSSAEHTDSMLRLDGLYVGKTPFGLALPRDRLSFVQAESADDRSAAAVVRPDKTGTISLQLIKNIPKDATPTEDARRRFYGAFGRFSVAMPLAFFISGLAFSYENASILYYDSEKLAELSDQAAFASAALWTVSAAFAAESIYRFVRYLRSSGSRAVKLAYVDES